MILHDLQLYWELEDKAFSGVVLELNPLRAPFHKHVIYLADDDNEWGYFQDGIFHTAEGDKRTMRGISLPDPRSDEIEAATVAATVAENPPPPLSIGEQVKPENLHQQSPSLDREAAAAAAAACAVDVDSCRRDVPVLAQPGADGKLLIPEDDPPVGSTVQVCSTKLPMVQSLGLRITILVYLE